MPNLMAREDALISWYVTNIWMWPDKHVTVIQSYTASQSEHVTEIESYTMSQSKHVTAIQSYTASQSQRHSNRIIHHEPIKTHAC